MEKNQKKQAKQAGWFMEMLVLTAAVAVVSVWWVSHLFRKRFKLSLEGWMLEAKEV